MSEPFLGQIQPFGFNFAPRGWATCDGQILSIAQNTALFSLLGTIYGGDGRTTFALPDLRGRAALHMGTGPGLTNRRIGQKSGQERVTLNTTQMPAHSHGQSGLPIYTGNADENSPVDHYLATSREETYSTFNPDAHMPLGPMANTGGSQSHNNMPPYLVLNWCIALTGIYPSRS